MIFDRVYLFVIIWSFLSINSNNVRALSVNNQLVPARNDCFVRVTFEAMLPFEKTFRTEDLNSFRLCKERCLQLGDKCQSIAFGVHRRGNGTCQLSEESYIVNGDNGGSDSGSATDRDSSNGRSLIANRNSRPSGVLFDPDFDLYTRKTNCFEINDNAITTEVFHHNDGDEGDDVILEEVKPTLPVAVTSQVSQQSNSVVIEKPTPPISISTDFGSPTLPSVNGGDHNHHTEGDTHFKLSTTTNYDDGITTLLHNIGLTSGTSSSVTPDVVPNGHYLDNADDRFYFTPDMYPLYKHPTLYEPNYSSINEPVYIPGGYASNAPEVDTHYRPPTNYNGPNVPARLPKPVFGLGYGTGFSYGQPETYMPSTHGSPTDSPQAYTPSIYPTYVVRKNTTTVTQQPAYGDRPSVPSPTDFMNFHTKFNTHTETSSSPTGPSYSTHIYPLDGSGVRRNDTIWDKHINTYFNPEYYLNGSKKRRPGLLEDSAFLNYHRRPLKTCFRRVLAGKRVAPHWVRRTIACERIEECMRECGREKRFTCEGFNYRLNPSGHGQGDCELIEIPLMQIDLYSSTSRRDFNLLRHPDYDYYERDRNAPPSCRSNLCMECKSSPISHISQQYYNGYTRQHSDSGWNAKPHKDDPYSSIPSSSGGSGSGGGDDYYLEKPLDGSIEQYQHSGSGPTGLLTPPSSYSYEIHSSGPYEISPHSSGYNDRSAIGDYDNTFSGGRHGSLADHVDLPAIAKPRPHYTPQRSHWQTIPSSSGSDGFKQNYRSGYSHTQYYPPPDTYKSFGSHRPYTDTDPSTKVSLRKYGTHSFMPHFIDSGDGKWDSYGNSYGWGYNMNKQIAYWGLGDDKAYQVKHHYQRKDPVDFNYFDLGYPPSRSNVSHESNSILNYPGSSYNVSPYEKYRGYRDHYDYKHQWTRRPGLDECSAKTSEGFRLHKKVVKHVYSVPTLTECERLCYDQDAFTCHTYSYRYSPSSRDNCLLCDRPINRLDYYADIEPDRDYDIYSMTDDMQVCQQKTRSDVGTPGGSNFLSDPRNAQCFFRAIDATRFYKSIVRDSLTVRSIGDCEVECIKSTKFTCRAFAFRYGHQKHASIIDNCQLSDWPVRDMDKERHLVLDETFDIFERASYGHGCEIQAIADRKHNKKSVCYLGYGSPARLLPAAIKKVITVASEADCKKECIRFRNTTPFKCFSFSYGSSKPTFNCKMSDLDQTELKLNVHYTHTDDKNFWLFAWNPFDYTCRDKVTTVGGSRVSNNRRMDIFRESAWRHFSVGGKACRRPSPCEKNLITGFYSCEIEGGEIGSWDYCCKIDHPCGYSQGFPYPWCFVGDEPDQWRKCSDVYYPGNHTNGLHDDYALKSYRQHSEKRKYGGDSHIIGPHAVNEYRKSSRSDNLQSLNDFTAARLWPVTYLYSEGPPNSTDFSNFVDCKKETC